MATFDVLLPVKNGIDYFAAAVDSIRTQTLRDWRLLILDHGSSDGSLELAYAYAARDDRIEVHELPQAGGLAELLNLGLDRCDCRYVLRQDADDISLPERMAALADAYERDPALAVVGSLGDVIDGQGRRIAAIDMPTGRIGITAAALFRTPICHPAASMRLAVLHRFGARYGEDFLHAVPGASLSVPALAEDYFLFGQFALLGLCHNLDRKLVRYRWHGANVGIMRYLDQMKVALSVSRHLADSLAALHARTSFDPAPFCTHGEALFDIEDRRDFSDEYEKLRALLSEAIPDGEELRRELAFRRVLSVRSEPRLVTRFLRFAARYGATQTERRAIKSWLLRHVRRRPMLRLPSVEAV